ncbi:hypothetical protein BN940_08011 [Castellaniella defragrans 65Phen]|uniref:Uncharacterized protein n=1 Tax=Castellaniella defragrans (strain DSM 12143 / CCUG 39792 / 65Phen) TaxID=1437824 RepID=W8X921_CASD6|nr:hypothetical protein BN940_08011 [Castellaniella defragrans 65Phen]
MAHREALGIGERLLELRREFVESHGWSPLWGRGAYAPRCDIYAAGGRIFKTRQKPDG